ncbi:MAG TPA: 2-oxoglutarate dehydrogenase complex dihydrolipoyllysine-residue succinyltransferase [Anaerolineaceae bacterium]|nr:2-oxoglutarate dehydrogenase complex dihydrolipoyllysine-residue succinyltransferase [Anaerolineaceae bacterium]
MAIEIRVPEMGESIIEATVARWMKNEGDPVAAGEPVVELETDKINLEVSAQQAGILERIERQAGEQVAVGDVLARIAPQEVGETAVPQTGSQPEAAEAPAREKNGDGRGSSPAPREESGDANLTRATPVAQRMAKEQGVDLSRITPTGSGGRITKEDVQAFLESTPAAAPAPARAEPPQTLAPPPVPVREQPAPAAPPSGAAARPETRQRMSRRRQTIARRLVEAQQTAAMLTTFNEIDMTRVIELRKRRRESFRERFGVDLGYMGFFIKAVIGALKTFPRVNAEIQGEELVLKGYYDIGIAVGAEEGLVVPVVRDADRLSFAEIETAIRNFVDQAKNNTFTLDDLRGGTFTITNGGVYGSLLSTPILNPPQVGILGMHRIQERPVAIDGAVVIRPMMYVALSYDHRIVDGREAVQFLVRVKELVEDPESLLLG